MSKRFLSIWFRYLQTDWVSNRQPELREIPFVLSIKDHGRMIVDAVNKQATEYGVHPGMVVADARVICPNIIVKDQVAGLKENLLKSFALWCIRFTPVAAVDLPDGIILDISGCAHLWGGEDQYAGDIQGRINALGYHVRIGIADTIGGAYAVARFSKNTMIEPGMQHEAIKILPPSALRLSLAITERLHKLGLKTIRQFMDMPASVLRRRFGEEIILRLQQAIGYTQEHIQPVVPVVRYQERLPCLELISTGTGIQIALEKLLELLCARLINEGKGIRTMKFTCYRVDHHEQHIDIGTHRPSQNEKHLFTLFEEKLPTIAPGHGIELFTLDAVKVEDVNPDQQQLWENNHGIECVEIGQLMDRITNKISGDIIHRYLPAAHHWPECSVQLANSMSEQRTMEWPKHLPRPLQLLPIPQPVMVTAPIPDYPPMLFRYRGVVHTIKKADGPERIEQEWWIQNGEHRDYYVVEDEKGHRYWLFRQGHYDPSRNNQWFLHGYFA